MHELFVESVKVLTLPKFIKAQYFKYHGKCLYNEMNSIYTYIMHTYVPSSLTKWVYFNITTVLCFRLLEYIFDISSS